MKNVNKKILLILIFFLILIIGFFVYRKVYKPESVGLGTPIQSVPDFKYKIKGANSAKIFAEYHFENDYYNYNYEFDLGDRLSGKLGVISVPDRESVEIVLTAISESGKKSKPLIFNTGDKFKRFFYLYIGHTFVIEDN